MITPRTGRDYRLFAKMAGVRNREGSGIKPISEPRGVPVDATFTTRFCYDKWGVDAHSASYLSSQEVKELCDWGAQNGLADGESGRWWWFENIFGYLFGSPYTSFHRYPEDYPEQVKDFRFVFWFYN
jgi:hypothetical protein